jgi:hypothetical protein
MDVNKAIVWYNIQRRDALKKNLIRTSPFDFDLPTGEEEVCLAALWKTRQII